MEAVKDERQFGTLLDGLTRLGAGNRVHPRWGETMKVASNFLEVGEYNAISASAMLWDSATAAEQKNGYLAQVLDEIRHTHQCGFVNHYYSKHYHDPAGHNDARRTRAIGPMWKGMKRVFADGFISGDAVECSINLQLVGEACFTNPLIVAVTEWASANGDEITPTVFLSIETDELRHMANGYQTIVSIANDPAAAEVPEHRPEQRLLDAAEILHAGAWLCCSNTARSSRSSRGSRPGTAGSTKTGAESGSVVLASMACRRRALAARRQEGRLLGAPRSGACWLTRSGRSASSASVAAGRRGSWPGSKPTIRVGMIITARSTASGRRSAAKTPRAGSSRYAMARPERPRRSTSTAFRRCRSCPSLSKGAGSLRVHEFNGQKHSFTRRLGRAHVADRAGALRVPERSSSSIAGRELSEVDRRRSWRPLGRQDADRPAACAWRQSLDGRRPQARRHASSTTRSPRVQLILLQASNSPRRV